MAPPHEAAHRVATSLNVPGASGESVCFTASSVEAADQLVPNDDGRKDSANERGTDAKLPSLMPDAGSTAVGEGTMPLGEW